MTRPREQLVSVTDTPYYHVVSRCVRRTFLCGFDRRSGISYEHRRQWIEERRRLLSSLFTIDLCAYAVMSNHYHLVVKLCPEQADSWSANEVLERWTSLFKGPPIVQRFLAGETLHEAELRFVERMVDLYRERLSDLSWFMKCLNESIAREANREDGCTGHFWESRIQPHFIQICSRLAQGNNWHPSLILPTTTSSPDAWRCTFLCGFDRQNGISYEHRRQWIEIFSSSACPSLFDRQSS